MLALLGVVLSVGFADSINPSTVGPALYLASYRDGGRSLGGFIAGVFAVSTLAGVVLILGPGRLLLTHHPTAHTEHLVEVAAGIGLVAVAAGLWLVRKRVMARVVQNERMVQRASILVGAGIMAIELPTALPYFAVIAAVAGSGRPLATQVVLVLLFNLMFVAPLLAVLSIRQLAGTRGLDWLASRRERLERRAGEIVPALVLAVAVLLLAIGMAGLAGD
ncbi:MAG: GAP family protein [Gaiellaceae bacterium]